MARTITDAVMQTRAARLRLRPRKKLYLKTLIPGRLALGYRRTKSDLPGRWLVRIYLGGERYRIVPLGIADDFADADNTTVINYAEAQKRALATKIDKPRHDGATVADAIAAHVEWMNADRPAAAAEFERTAERHILPKLGAIPLAKLTTEQITRWRDGIAAAPAYHSGRAAPTTEDGRRARRASANRIYCVLRAALNRAFDQGMAESNTAWKRVKMLRNASAARLRFLSVQEAQRLLNAAGSPEFRDLLHAGLLTGARFSELCRLEVRDFRHNKLHVLRSKSGKERWIVLTEEGVAFFTALAAGRDGAEPLLRRADGGPWKKDMQQPPMERACVAARLHPRATFHSLRHTYASLSVMAGMPLLVLATNLGHANIDMVTKHYGHLSAGFLDAEVQRAAPRFGMLGEAKVHVLPHKNQ
jgi:integrase